MSAVGTTAETETRNTTRTNSAAATQIVVCLGPWYEDAPADLLSPLLQHVRQALGERVSETLIAYPVSDPHGETWQHEGFTLQPYLPLARVQALAVQTSATYLSLYQVMRTHSAHCGLLLGAEAQTLSPAALRGLLDAVLERGADVALARYATSPNEALINASILQPLSRAVFSARISFPLSIDVALSSRMGERMAAAAQRLTAASHPDAVVWPVSEAAVAGYTLAEVDAGVRELPRPAGDDLSTILNATAASLFSDIEAKAAFWQRSRSPLVIQSNGSGSRAAITPEPLPPDEIADLAETFRIGYGNLHEIWSLILPPQTLLGLKRLSTMPSDQFAMADALWVRVVYDFLLAHRLRTINRGHLMGALTPLYLAWVASHLQRSGTLAVIDAQETLARAFEADKPYLVSRWRWPDRFNP